MSDAMTALSEGFIKPDASAALSEDSMSDSDTIAAASEETISPLLDGFGKKEARDLRRPTGFTG